MAAGGKLAEAFVEIGTHDKRLDTGLADARNKIGAFADFAKTALASLAVSIGMRAMDGAFDFLKKGVLGASDLAETMSKTEVVFGKASATVKNFADDMAARFGTSKQTILDAAASIGLIGKASGLSQPAAADLSVQLAKLADDASSFYNVPLSEALDKIKSALVGESEPIRSFGVLLNEAAVQAEAMSLGLSKNGKDLTEGQKVMARSSLIIKGMKDATGDHEKTQASFSNQIKEVQGRLENFATTIGDELLPALTSLITLVSPAISKFEELAIAIARATSAGLDWADLAPILGVPVGGPKMQGVAPIEMAGGGQGGADFSGNKEKIQALGNTILARLGAALNAGAEMKGLALAGAGVAGNQLFRDRKESMNVGFTDSESYARELQEAGLKGADIQKEILQEQKNAVSELGAIKDALKNKAASAIKAVFG